jgi:ubiquinone biosynthesis protein
MKLSLKPHHLKRYKDIAMLFWKYGTSDLAKEFANEAAGDEKNPAAKPGQPAPEELADDLEKMGPTFIKFGQLLSSRPDLLPEPYLKALARLQDKVKPFPYEQVEEIIASELGIRISKAFSYFEEKHLAAASLGPGASRRLARRASRRRESATPGNPQTNRRRF